MWQDFRRKLENFMLDILQEKRQGIENLSEESWIEERDRVRDRKRESMCVRDR